MNNLQDVLDQYNISPDALRALQAVQAVPAQVVGNGIEKRVMDAMESNKKEGRPLTGLIFVKKVFKPTAVDVYGYPVKGTKPWPIGPASKKADVVAFFIENHALIPFLENRDAHGLIGAMAELNMLPEKKAKTPEAPKNGGDLAAIILANFDDEALDEMTARDMLRVLRDGADRLLVAPPKHAPNNAAPDGAPLNPDGLSVVCAGKKANGNPCSLKTRHVSGLCHHHRD